MHSHPSHFPSFSWGWGTTNFLPSSLPPERRVSITSSRERCSDRTTCSKARPCSCRWSTKTVLPWRSIARSSGRRKQTRTGSLSASMKIMASLPEDRDPAAQPLPEGVLLGLPLLVPAHLVEAGGGAAAVEARVEDAGPQHAQPRAGGGGHQLGRGDGARRDLAEVDVEDAGRGAHGTPPSFHRGRRSLSGLRGAWSEPGHSLPPTGVGG